MSLSSSRGDRSAAARHPAPAGPAQRSLQRADRTRVLSAGKIKNAPAGPLKGLPRDRLLNASQLLGAVQRLGLGGSKLGLQAVRDRLLALRHRLFTLGERRLVLGLELPLALGHLLLPFRFEPLDKLARLPAPLLGEVFYPAFRRVLELR